jgi:hypothetical protein
LPILPVENDSERKKVLLLCHYYPGVAGAIVDHIFAFEKYSRNKYFVLSNFGDLPDWLDLSRFDALVFHYSLVASYDSYISALGRKQIRDFRGFKAAFVQDDYRWINDTVNAFSYMGIHALFPLAGPDIIRRVYSPKMLPNVRMETVLAGYVPEELIDIPVKPYQERRVDVGYRARKLPPWMGSHTLQKWQIAEKFIPDALRYNLKVDISYREEDRVYGAQWIEFLTNCKATLGTESGASVCDFTGDIQRNVEAHLQKDPDADFETLRNLYFRDEDNKITMNVISPRCFEAAALRTLMILYEGNYSGVLMPGRHYVALRHDHSNMDEVVRILRTPVAAQSIIDQAYEEVAKNENYSYKSMVHLVDRVMNEEWSTSLACGHNYYVQEEFEKHNKQPRSNRVIHWLVDRSSNFGTNETPHNLYLANLIKSADRDITFEVPLGLLLSPKSMAIRWDTDSAPAPRWFEIYGLRKGRVILNHRQANTEQKSFQFFDLPAACPAVDQITIKSITPRSAQPIVISIYREEPSKFALLNARLKSKIVSLMFILWSNLPNGIRVVLRPFVRPLFYLTRTLLIQKDREYFVVGMKWALLRGIYCVWRAFPDAAKHQCRRLLGRRGNSRE